MIRILKANMKKFMGAKYQRVARTFALWAILIFALSSSEIRMDIAPAVVWLTGVFTTAGGFIQVLTSDDVIDSLQGQLMLPEKPESFHGALFLSVASYIFLTKAGLFLVIYLTVSRIQLSAVIGFALCFLVTGAAIYPAAFRTQKKVTQHRHIRYTRNSFIFYLLRYVGNNKKYLVNTAALWVFGCIFALAISKNVPEGFLPVGFALMCFNTPLGILLSSDKDLYRQVRFLPNQAGGILLPYGLFAAAVNLMACGLYLIVWWAAVGPFSSVMILLALSFSIASAGLTAGLEIKFPVLDWRVESDLWHHPRKYVVPGINLFLALSIVILMGEC